MFLVLITDHQAPAAHHAIPAASQNRWIVRITSVHPWRMATARRSAATTSSRHSSCQTIDGLDTRRSTGTRYTGRSCQRMLTGANHPTREEAAPTAWLPNECSIVAR